MKLSIITINRNNAEGLERTISSVVTQTFTNFEYIIIDGASTDSSVNIIKKYTNKIMKWISEPDSGIYNAMNKGISYANGEYCLFLNSGDRLFDTNSLKRIFDNNLSKDIVYSDILNINNGKEDRQSFPQVITAGFLFSGCLAHPSIFFKRSLFNLIGFYDETFSITADHDFLLKAFCLYNVTYSYVPEITSVFYFDGLSSDPKNSEKIHLEHLRSFATHFPSFFEDYKLNDESRLDSIMNYCVKKKQSKVFRIIIRVLRKIFP